MGKPAGQKTKQGPDKKHGALRGFAAGPSKMYQELIYTVGELLKALNQRIAFLITVD